MGGRVASPTFVGRLEELELLEAARVRAADGDPAVVLVGGEAGVGKTRLVAELTTRCASGGTRVLAGGCVPVGDGALPYAPIVEALRGLLSDVGAGAVRELVGPSWPELARLLPALGEPEAGSAGPAAQARLFELLLGLLGRLGEQAPLVLVVEDLHWADHSTRDLLAFLARNLRRERVLLVVSYRNDEPGRQRLGPYLAELDRSSRVERIELLRLATTGYDRIKQVTGSADGKTVTVVFDQKFADWKGLFGNLLPAHYVQGLPGGWNRGLDKHPERIPSGGPFKVAEFRPGETVTLRRNDQFWGPRAHLDQILIRHVPDSDAQLDALRNHEADVIDPDSTADLVNHVRQLPGVRSQVSPTLGFEHLTFNLDHPILAELAVRRAIATAVNTEQLVDRLLRPVNPDAQPLRNRIWLTGQQYYQDHSGGYGNGDTQAAKRLLEGAGWTMGGDGVYAKGGKRLELRCSTFVGDPRRRAEGELLQAQLAEAGIQLSLANTTVETLFGTWLPGGNFDIADFAWIGSPFAISGNQDIYRTGGGGNFGKFSDPTVDALFHQAVGELDPARAAAIGNQIDQQLWTQLPLIPLYQLQSFLAWREDLVNVEDNPTTQGPFWNAGNWGFANP